MSFLSILRVVFFALLFAAGPGLAENDQPLVTVIEVNGAISPGSADYIVRSLQAAADRHAALAVLEMDTPGGLDTAMRQIIKQIVASTVPVAAFVAPSGARAASAGTYILYACHIAAMAPGTNLGAATPVMIGLPGEPGGSSSGNDKNDEKNKSAPATGSTEARKSVNDAAAYIRSLAQMRGRNADWAEQAVRQAVSLTASEALKKHVIDLVAQDVPDLLHHLDGRSVNVLGVPRTLHLEHARIDTVKPDWRSRLLSVIADPSVAYLLMLAGIFGLFFEFSNPGFMLPGVVGAICLLLALFAFQMMPVNYVGVALILLGIAFMVAEVYVSSFGALGVGGIAAFVIGSVMLVDTKIPGYGLSWTLIAPVAAASALFIFAVASMALKAHLRKPHSGREEMIGLTGTVLEDSAGNEGWLQIHGETWHFRCPAPLRRGDKVKVVRLDGLYLEGVPVTAEDENAQPDAAP